MPTGHDPPPATTTSVLLRHHTPDGAHHLDWMIERPIDPSAQDATPPAEHRLITFRCQTDPLAAPPWTGDRLADHRAHYLTHEGPVPGDRGRVERLWSRPCRLTRLTPDALTVELIATATHPAATLALARREGTLWESCDGP